MYIDLPFPVVLSPLITTTFLNNSTPVFSLHATIAFLASSMFSPHRCKPLSKLHLIGSCPTASVVCVGCTVVPSVGVAVKRISIDEYV